MRETNELILYFPTGIVCESSERCLLICKIAWKSVLFLSNVTKVCSRNAMHDIPQMCMSYQLHVLEGNVFQRKRMFCWKDSDVSGLTGFNNKQELYIYFSFGWHFIYQHFYYISPHRANNMGSQVKSLFFTCNFQQEYLLFHFNQQCTICIFYFNNIYVIITPKWFDTFISSFGSSKVVHR
jgi:hypothetical protein